LVTGNLNTGVTLSANATVTAKIAVRSSFTNLRTVAETEVFTVPSGYMFLIETMEVITTAIDSPGTAPTIRFGTTATSDLYFAPQESTSNSLGSRYVLQSPQDGAIAGTIITFGVTSGSTASTHTGVAIIAGCLLKIS
jgi:hypothetical protein